MSESICGKARRTNTGSFDCDEARKYPTKLIVGFKKFTPEECATPETFKAALIAATELDSDHPDKLFALNTIEDPQNTTEANKTGQVGDGPKRILKEGKPSFTYRVEMGQDLYKRWRRLNKRIVPVYTYDDSQNLWGADDTDENFVGCRGMLFFSDNTQQTSSTPTSALVNVDYQSATQYHDEAVYVPVELGEFEPAGLVDAELRVISKASNVYKIAIEVKTAKKGTVVNIAEKYSAALVVGLFSAATGTNFGTPLALTSAAYDSTLKCMTITCDSTAHTALPADTPIRFALDPVADLKAANITGIEGVAVVTTK